MKFKKDGKASDEERSLFVVDEENSSWKRRPSKRADQVGACKCQISL